jgi:hypothetical protein
MTSSSNCFFCLQKISLLNKRYSESGHYMKVVCSNSLSSWVWSFLHYFSTFFLWTSNSSLCIFNCSIPIKIM